MHEICHIYIRFSDSDNNYINNYLNANKSIIYIQKVKEEYKNF